MHCAVPFTGQGVSDLLYRLRMDICEARVGKEAFLNVRLVLITGSDLQPKRQWRSFSKPVFIRCGRNGQRAVTVVCIMSVAHKHPSWGPTCDLGNSF